ncbi:MAG TPA: amino acid adenylation domain-containing protein, partial [Thermoanaerobaculia bacterium]|nr:amino acid adenylation domain-containing protein [Thermoanaerobaculia bacterium]
LPAALTAGLRALGRSSGATLFMSLLAGFQALLARYSAENAAGDAAPVGAPVAGRTRLETEPLVGFFVNTLVLHTSLAGNPSFTVLLDRARETTLGAYEHQDVPFERLVEELAPRRDLRHTPLFQVMLAFQNAPRAALELPGLHLELLEDMGPGTAKFDLSLTLAEQGEELAAWLEYDLDLFDAATAGRMAGHFRTLLEGAVAEPGRRLWDLPLLGEAERREIAALDHAQGSVREPLCLHELFEARAALAPDAPALIAGGETLSYGQLDARAGGLARRLRELGVGPEVRVGLSMPRSVDGIVAILGILKAGGAWVALDPALPPDRRAWMLADARVRVLITGDSMEILEGGEAPSGLLPGSLAYVIYTSGSTGTPKGVAVEHRAAADHLRTVVEAYGLTERDRVLQTASWGFDISVEQILAPLAAGAAVVLWEGELDPLDLPRRAAALGATVLDLPPALLQLWARQAAGDGDRLPIRLVIAGGEALSPEVARLWPSTPLRGARLINGYGPTEAVITATLYDVTAAPSGGVPIGRPLPGRSAHVVDWQCSPAPLGVAGELALGGVLARGYLGRPAATAERFVPDPFGQSPGARLYRTGDRVRRLAGGDLEFLGRVDQQVKVRGFRIEPGEIEAALARHPAVSQAAVVVAGDGAARRLVAFLAGRGGEALPDAAGLRDFLGRALPDYMVPAAFVTIAALPLTPNGKVDRRALIRQASTLEAPGRAFVAPSSRIEEVLAGIWAEVLGLGRIGVHDDFFALGGHSLLATQVQSRVREALGVELPLRKLFEAPTVAVLAREVETLREPEGHRGAPPLRRANRPAGRREAAPLSFAQERLWFLDRFAPGGAHYNMAAAVRLNGDLDVAALSAALGETVRRHEALRTVFMESPETGQPVQVVTPWRPRQLAIIDLSASPSEARRLALAEAHRPFDLAAGDDGWMARSALLRLGSREHILLVTLHHIAADGWSVEIFLREMTALYGAFRAGRPSPLAELPIQYADYAVWQRSWLHGEEMEARLAYWRGMLAGLPPSLDLPADRPRPAVPSFRGGVRRLELPASLSAGLQALARREGATLFMVLMAGFQALLSRYSGEEDVAVGTPVANRGRLATEGLIGFFVNTLVMRLDLSGDPSFGELTGRARETALAAFAHEDLPFERLVEELAPQRDKSRTPLFQTMFTLQSGKPGAPEFAGLAAEALELESGTAKFDLLLALGASETGISGALEHSADLFDGATAARMLSHLSALLTGAAADPGRRLADLPLLGEAELGQVLAAWNDTATGYPREASLRELFRSQVERAPEAEALDFFGERLTYAELDARANRLARHLRAEGVGRESLVGVLLDRSADLIVTLLAVIKAGGAYLPLDPSHPADRLAWMLEDSGAALVVTRERLDGDAARIAAYAGEDLAVETSADDLAYVMYTSGSTGRPKGVAIPQRAIARLLFETDYVALGPDERIAHLSNVSFDAATFEIWGALLHGGCVVGIAREVALNPGKLAAAVAKKRISAMFLTTALFQQVVREAPEAFSGLRHLLFGGEACDPRIVRAALEKSAPGRLLHVYGPTESTTFAAWHRVEEVAPGASSVPIGGPLANTTLYVLDRRLQPAPVGVAGELYIGGDGLARGYWNRPELTAERFVPNPFGHLAGKAGSRLYRTGDLVRFLPGGAVDFLGRADHQVKVRGFRIELGEVEAALAAHPAVREAVVAAPREEGAGGSRRLVAYVTGDPAPDARELRAFLSAALPDYMVPSVFVPLAALPLTPNGKVDRRALPDPEGPAGDADAYVAPRTPVEEILAGLWMEVLGAGRVGVLDDFFELGGHSLLATRLVSRIRRTFGSELALAELFEAPTVAGLAVRLATAGPPAPRPLVARAAESGEIPLSFAQERLWFLDRLRPGSSAYNMPAAVRLTGDLDVAALAAAVSEIVRRHEALRTVFVESPGTSRPVQVVTPWRPRALAIIDLSTDLSADLPAASWEEERLALEEARRPFDLVAGDAGWMVRGALLRLGTREHVLLVTLHHIAADGWSVEVFLREMTVLYGAFRAGRPSPLADLPIQYADFAVWQRSWLRDEELESRLAYWRGRLDGLPPSLDLPADRPRPAAPSFRGGVRRLELPASLSAGLQALARREGATLFMVLLAGFQALLSRYSGQEDVAVGTPVANRGRLETEGLIGFFVNTLVMRLDLSGDPSFGELTGRTRAAALAAFAHEDLPFEKLVEELAPVRDLGRTPLFQAMLTFQNAGPGRPEFPGLTAETVEVRSGTAKLDLLLALGTSETGLSGALEYAADLFDATTAERMLSHLSTLLAAAHADPGLRLSGLPLLGEAERDQMLAAWNDTASEYPREASLREL